jgi:hypothetical protein
MNNEPVAWIALNQLNNTYSAFTDGDKERMLPHVQQLYANWIQLYTHQAELTDEEWDKAFDHYCETDEGVLKFDLELRDEWKKEQLIRWKEALRKAQNK